MQELNTVAICIPTFNQAQYLIKSISSACCQTYPNVEVWVSDDASTDNTPEVMAQLCRQFPQILYYRQPQNLGIAANNTWLLSQPSTEFIVRLDSDDILQSNYVEKLVKLLQKYPDAGYAHAAIQEIDERGNKRGIRQLARQEEFRNPEKELRAAVFGFRLAANICMFRTKALQQCKFYEIGLDYAEDYNLIIKMADAGYGNVYTNEVLASYRVWTDTKAIRPKRKSQELRGLIHVYEKSLLPAFQRRGWNTKVLVQQRSRLALNHSAYCYRPFFTKSERAELIKLLKELGDSPALKVRLLALHYGFASFFEWRYLIELKLKRKLKDWLNILNTFLKRQSIANS